MEVREDRFFLGFGREVGQEVNIILGKCRGGGVEIVNFFSIDCERSTVHIYISARGFCVGKTVFFFFLFFFLGFCFVHLPKAFFLRFCFGYQETTGYSSLDFFLSSRLPFFSTIFSSTFKRHFLPPFFVLPSFSGILIFRPFPYSSSYRMFLIVFVVVFLGFTYSFIFIYLSNFYHLFFFSYFFQFVVVYFLYPSILFLGLQDARRNSKEQVQNEQQGTNSEVTCQLLDSPVRPIRSHACEVWTGGIGATGLQQVEQVHRMFLRGILGVNKTTSTFAMSGEFGRFPREHFWWQQTFKYYDRPGGSTPDRLSYRAYQTQLQMLSVPNDNQQCRLRNVQLWLDDEGVGAPILMSSVL